jgi:hypothetical protein
MTLQRSKTAVVSIFVLLVLLIAIGPVAAEGEKSEGKKETAGKADKSAQKSESAPPVSSIYEAARGGTTKKDETEDAVVITNEDLERMMAGLTPEQKLQGVYQAERHIGAPTPAAGGQPGAAAPGQELPSEQKPLSSLEWMEERNAAANENRVEHVDAEKQVAELSAKVADLEKRLLALKNPLLPRRYSDKKDEEVEDWDEKNNLERVETTQKELDEARAELAAAQAKLGKSR